MAISSAAMRRFRSGAVGSRLLGGLLAGAVISGTAWAGSFNFWGVEGSYKATLSYAGAMRMEDPDEALINGPVDPLVAVPPSPPEQPWPQFHRTGLPKTINQDDGNRNFEKGDLVNNRLSLFTEFQFKRDNYGLVLSGDIFSDESYRDPNSNNSPETVNKLSGDVNEFTSRARYYSGNRARLLEAYAYGDWGLFGDRMFLNVRVGEHVVAWGESLFNSGLMLAMGHADAGRAFVPGAEIKEILLPHNQISATLAVSPELSFMGYYKLEFDPTELFPYGHYFSPSDAVGPGATFVYGSINPAFGDGCPGLFNFTPLGDLSFICSVGGLGGPLLNAEPNILTYRLEDIEPSKSGQWGLGASYQITPSVNLGFYHIKYHSPNPTVTLNFGCAKFGDLPPELLGLPAGPLVELDTCLLNQEVPVTYQVKYFGDIEMNAISASGVLGPFSVTAEIAQRDGIDVQALARVSGVPSPIFTPGKVNQVLLSALYVSNPKFLLDEIAVIGELAHFRVEDFKPIQARNGLVPAGNGDVLFTDDKSTGFQMLALGKKRNAFAGWDVLTSFTYGEIFKGNPPITGAFGALFGEGDRRFSLNFGVQHLQNLEVGIGYNWLLGDADAQMASDKDPDAYTVPQNPFVDRDYATLTIKYNL
jgi:hypothetical protein